MIDIKKHINRQFSKACDTYESDAFIQKKMAEHLMFMLCSKSFFKILEIGSGTGYLTSLIVNQLDYRSLFLNFECNSIFYRSDIINDLKKDFIRTMDDSDERLLKDIKNGYLYNLTNNFLRIITPLL